ncbi:MAG: DUF3575 domain-containing protein [bacterium]
MKKYNIKYIIVAVILLFFSISASAQYSEKVEIYFETGSSVIDRGYRANSEVLSGLEAKLKYFMNDTATTIDKIIIDSYTSPEGGVSLNKALSLRRAKAIGDYINNLGLDIPMSLIELNSNGIAWNELREIVSVSDMSAKGLIIKIIDEVPEETWAKVPTSRWLQLVDSRNKHLMDLKGGNPYRYMMENIFPLLRSGSLVTIYFIEKGAPTVEELEPEPEAKPEPEVATEESEPELVIVEPEAKPEPEVASEESEPEPADPAASEEPEAKPEPADPEASEEPEAKPEPAPEEEPEAKPEPEPVIEEPELTIEPEPIYKPLFALKTNLLYDAVTVLNAEIEVPIGKRWSIAGEWIFPWWTSCGSSYNNWQTNSQRNTLQLLQGNLEVKYWFGNRTDRLVLTGWNAALGGGFGLYDFEYKAKGYQGEFYVIYTLSGGYAHTINKSGNLRLEYSLGFGYLQTNYDKYEEHLGIDGQWHTIRTAMGKFSWFGPTKAEVSLVWMLNRRVNETK